MKRLEFEREFLKLAGTAFACTLEIMGGEIPGRNLYGRDMAFSCLGLVDHCGEMRLLCQEAMGKRLPVTVWHPPGRPTVEKCISRHLPA